jgi:hypothetical protein
MRVPKRGAFAGLAAAVSLAAAIMPAAASSNSTTLPNGALLTVALTAPAAPATYLVPAGAADVDVPVAGSASIGTGAPNVHWTYVIDVSGSTGEGCGAAGGTILDCEKAAVTNLNNAVDAGGSAVDVALSVFGENGASADMSPAAGQQLLAAPSSANVDTVIGSVVIGGVNQFTVKSVGSGSTNFGAGLQAALASVTASSAASKNVVFLSDGLSNAGSGFAAALAALDAAGATIYSFAVGAGSSCSAGTNGSLNATATATGGTCTAVPNPSALPQIVKDVTATRLTSVSLTVDSGATAFTSIVPAPPFAGPGSTHFTATAADQAPGQHEACATAKGLGPTSDATSLRTVTTCETYQVFGFGLTPPTATNELGSDHTHTVTATVTGAAGQLAGWPVAFSVSGTNAGTTGVCAPTNCRTNSAGVVTFTYSVPVAPASLGTDSITATVTIDDETGSRVVKKSWVDTTPPVATCVQGPNPDGTIPPANNQDGFFTLAATDDVFGSQGLKIYVKDDGSGHVFGPFADPVNIKYTEANGATPSQKPGSGVVAYHLKGKGDALVYAVDGAGNQSTAVACLVPPKPQ